MRKTTKYIKQMAIQDKIILVLKGILLYTTTIVCMLSVAGIDDIYDKGYFFTDIAICAALIYACRRTISEDDLDTLSLDKYFGDNKEEDDEW